MPGLAASQLRRAFVCALALTFALAAADSASATVVGQDEPAYTKTNGNNSFWWSYTRVNGTADNQNPDSNLNGINDGLEYYLCFRTTENGNVIETSNGTNGPGSLNCGVNSQFGNSGFYGAVPLTTNTVLFNGRTYSMCASAWHRFALIWSQIGISQCPTTTIDRDAPTIGVALANGANVTNNQTIPAAISYNDPISPPWFGSNGYASNWVCIQQGSNCTPAGQPDNNCSAPNGGFGSRINSFNCGLNIGGGDGTYHFCARAADAAIPDNASGANQFANAFSNNANLSSVQCDSVILDRAGPSVSVTPSATTVTVGDLVSFSAAASDPNGLSGAPGWSFGDNTAGSTGPTATHTYTQAGTYVVKATQQDAAGNTGEGTATITVNPAPSGGGGSGGSNTPVTPGTQQGTSGATTVTGGTTQTDLVSQIQQQSGGGGVANVDLGGLDVVAPKKFKAGKRTLLLALTSENAGEVSAALLRRAKVVARKGAVLGGPGTYTLKLRVPKKLKAGSYKLKITFKPEGAASAITKTAKVTVTKKRARGSASAQVGGGQLRGSRASRSRNPKAVDPGSVDRTINVP